MLAHRSSEGAKVCRTRHSRLAETMLLLIAAMLPIVVVSLDAGQARTSGRPCVASAGRESQSFEGEVRAGEPYEKRVGPFIIRLSPDDNPNYQPSGGWWIGVFEPNRVSTCRSLRRRIPAPTLATCSRGSIATATCSMHRPRNARSSFLQKWDGQFGGKTTRRSGGRIKHGSKATGAEIWRFLNIVWALGGQARECLSHGSGLPVA